MAKKVNRGGFTLAELLIVIAIIAILIAIAIPVFGAQLENARLQADHANMRSAYAIAQVASIDGKISIDDAAPVDISTLSSGSYYYSTTGMVSTTSPYVCKAEGDTSSKCTESAVCVAAAKANTGTNQHTVGAKLKFTVSGTKVTVTLEQKA